MDGQSEYTHKDFSVTSATEGFTLNRQYSYVDKRHVHIECYGYVTIDYTSSATTQPFIIIPLTYAPATRITSIPLGAVSVANSVFFPALAEGSMFGSNYCVTQKQSGSINTGDAIRFMLDYSLDN